MKNLLLIVLATTACSVRLFAQEILFERISPEQGLSQGSVNYIFQDREGYMWFSTRDGINRFDGHEFTVFENDPTDPASLSSDHAKCLYEDRQGNMWVGTVDGGLNRWDRSSGAFTEYLFDKGTPNSLRNIVQAICEDQMGYLWIGTVDGLNKFDPKSGEFSVYRADPVNKNSLAGNDVRAIFLDKAGNLWIGTSSGLSKFNPVNEVFTNYFHEPTNPNSLSSNAITALFYGQNHTIWIGTFGGGLNRFDEHTGLFTHYRHNAADVTSLSDDYVTVVCESRSGSVWVGTRFSGINVLQGDSKTFSHYQHKMDEPHHLADNYVLSIYEDRTHTIWVGTFTRGISKYDPLKNKFSHYKITGIGGSPGMDNIHALYGDKAGYLWTGMNGKITRLDRKTGQYSRYTLTPSVHNSRWRDYNVYVIYEDSKGRFWTGSSGIGLSLFDQESETFRHYRPDTSDINSALGTVTAISEDQKGLLWLATSNGLSAFDPETKKFTTYVPELYSKEQKYPDCYSISYLTSGRPGELWLGASSYGLLRFDCQSRTFTRYQPSDFAGVKGKMNNISFIHYDRRGYVWVCYWKGGLYRFDPSTESFTAYSGKNGLPNNTFRAILEDNAGNLWISTMRGGLYRLNPKTKAFVRFDTRDGLQSNEFNGACYRSSSGEMFFGGNEGLSFFNPGTLTMNPYAPPLIISGFRVLDEPKRIDSDGVRLKHNKNSFSFEFVALNYTLPEKNQYKYMLEGFDKKWTSTDRRFASYTNVNPGIYTFRVIGANNDGVWNDTGASIKVIINKPYWQEWWFRTMIGSILVALAFAFYKLRINAIENQKRQLEQLVRERTDELRKKSISLEVNNRVIKTQRDHLEKANLKLEESLNETEQLRVQAEEASRFKTELLGIAVHDLKNPLGGIRLYAELIRDSAKDKDTEKVVELASVVERTAQSMFDLISNLLKSVKVNNSRIVLQKQIADLAYVAGDVVEHNRLLAARKGQTIEFHCAGECTGQVDVKLIKEIFDNLLSNAIKYSPRYKTIWTNIIRVEDKVIFQVKDEGVGMREEDMPKLFTKFQRFSQPTAGESSTGLGLSIVRQLVELHGGRVWASSEGLSKGSMFVVELPATDVPESTIAR